MGRIKPRTVSELMEIASRFVDGDDAYHNKRERSPEHDRSNRYNNHRCRSRNDDSQNPRNQVAVGIREAAKKEASEGTTGTTEEMTEEERDQETLTRHPRISSMDHATYITHTSREEGFQSPNERLQDIHETIRSNGIQPSRKARIHNIRCAATTTLHKDIVSQGYPRQSNEGYSQSKIYIAAMI
jgi:hypothetical protein